MSDVRSPDHDPQPAPTAGDGRSVTDEVLAAIEARRQLGRTKYGTELRPHNGRDALLDLRDELLDAVMYTQQLIIEREAHNAP